MMWYKSALVSLIVSPCVQSSQSHEYGTFVDDSRGKVTNVALYNSSLLYARPGDGVYEKHPQKQPSLISPHATAVAVNDRGNKAYGLRMRLQLQQGESDQFTEYALKGEQVSALAFTPRDSLLIAAVHQLSGSRLVVFDVSNERLPDEPLCEQSAMYPIKQCAIRSDEREVFTIATVQDVLRFFTLDYAHRNLIEGEIFRQTPGTIHDAAWYNDLLCVACKRGLLLREFGERAGHEKEEILFKGQDIRAVEVCDRYIIAGTSTGQVKLISMEEVVGKSIKTILLGHGAQPVTHIVRDTHGIYNDLVFLVSGLAKGSFNELLDDHVTRVERRSLDQLRQDPGMPTFTRKKKCCIGTAVVTGGASLCYALYWLAYCAFDKVGTGCP